MFRSLRRLCLAAVFVVIFFCGFVLGSDNLAIADVQNSLSQAICDGLDPEKARIYAEELMASEKIGPFVGTFKEIMKNILDSICIFVSDVL